MRKGLRKLAAVVLTAAMALSIATPAFASDNDQITKENLISLANKYNLEIEIIEKPNEGDIITAESIEEVEKELLSAMDEKRVPITTVSEYIVDLEQGIITPINEGIELMDYQKYVFMESWNKQFVLWLMSRSQCW